MVWVEVSAAGVRDGAVALSGSLQSQNIVRHPDVDEYHFIQQRNTLHARLHWELGETRLGRRLGARGVQLTRLVVAYRATYDSIYDATPTLRERDLRGRKPSRNAMRDLGDLSPQARDAIKHESQLRAAYVEGRVAHLPMRFRLGKQQVVWGEADFFRLLDRANPLDISWHGVQELPPPAFGWDDLRIPLWMLRLWIRLGVLGPLSDIVLETYWTLGDWRPARVSFLPRPWGVRLLNPLTNEEDGAFRAPFTGIERLANGTSLFRQGNYRRHPGDNSQVGIKLTGALPQGLRLGLYYFYQRWAGDDGTPTAPVAGMSNDPAGRISTQRLIGRGTLPAEFIAPYVQSIGVSLNYFDARLTNATYRLESVYDVDLPLFDRAKETTLSPLLPGIGTRDYWRALIAFDLAAAAAWLNPDSAIFISGQAVVHRLLGSTTSLTGPLDLPTAGRRPRAFCGLPPPEPCTDPNGNGSFRDNVHPWEMLGTLAILTFLRGGTVVPTVGVVVDPINSYATNLVWSLDLAWWPRVTVNVSQRFFVSAQDDVQKGPFDPWHVGTQRGRSETALRVTYGF